MASLSLNRSTIWNFSLSMIAHISLLFLHLLILTHGRPDICYAVEYLSQYMQDPSTPHYSAVLRVLRYLRVNSSQGLLLSADSSLKLVTFCDADWRSCVQTRRSVSEFFVTLDGSPISWKSKKHISVSLSLAEAEYHSMRRVVAELTWLDCLISDLGCPSELPIPVHSDSQSVIHIARNPVFHERTKHVELDCHFFRQHFFAGLISLSNVPAYSQITDLFTKALFGPSHHTILCKLGIFLLSSNLGRGGGGCVENGVSPNGDSISAQSTDEKEREKDLSIFSTYLYNYMNSEAIQSSENFPSFSSFTFRV